MPSREDYVFDNSTEPWTEHPDPEMIDPLHGMWQSTQQHANQVGSPQRLRIRTLSMHEPAHR